jgi:hypothetical protein
MDKSAKTVKTTKYIKLEKMKKEMSEMKKKVINLNFNVINKGKKSGKLKS